MALLILSPHRDDAAFSCGLILRSALASGATAAIVNVCTVSEYAPYLPEYGADRLRQVTAARAKEDDVFAARLTRDAAMETSKLKFIDLGWRDAPVRWGVENEQVLAPWRLRAEEMRDLSRSLRELPGADLVIAPLALGGHVDHVLVREAAKEAVTEGELVFYEDLPYACRMSVADKFIADHESQFAAGKSWLPDHAGIAGAKRTYASCYPSQISSEVAEEMETYAAAMGGRERFIGKPEALRKLQSVLTKDGFRREKNGTNTGAT